MLGYHIQQVHNSNHTSRPVQAHLYATVVEVRLVHECTSPQCIVNPQNLFSWDIVIAIRISGFHKGLDKGLAFHLPLDSDGSMAL